MRKQLWSIGERGGIYTGTLRQVSLPTLLLEKFSSLKSVSNVGSERSQLLSWWMDSGRMWSMTSTLRSYDCPEGGGNGDNAVQERHF